MKSLKYLLVAILLVAFQPSIMAQIQDNKEVTAKAEVLAPILVTNATVMDFGKLYAFADAYTVTLLPDATSDKRTSTSANVPTLSDGTVKLALLDVEGPANSSFSISYPTTSIDLSHAEGTATMELSAIKAYTLNGSEINSAVTMGEAGQYKFRVGATLSLVGGQEVGLYEGSFDVTVTYE